MGGGDSKPEEPQPKQNDSVSRVLPSKQPLNSHSKLTNLSLIPAEPQDQDDGQVGYFQSWEGQFQEEGCLGLKVMVLGLHAGVGLAQLQRQFSQHQGQLSWHYQTLKAASGSQLCLRFIFQEKGGYFLTFLLSREFLLLQGHQDVWDILSPFRTQQQVIKIGGLFCERTYQQDQASSEPVEIDSRLFEKWGEKEPDPRTNMRALLQKRRQQSRLRSNQGLRYREVSKYFAADDAWAFSVLAEERPQGFKCWVVEQAGTKHQEMSATLKGDIENREKMYVQEMRRRRKLMKGAQQERRRS